MIVTIVRLYDHPGDAANAVEALRKAEVPEHDISILTRDDPARGAARGAEIGAVVGGVAGLAAALGLAIPGIGPILATGWLAATAAGAAAGGLAGGALGLLSQAGLSREDAHEIAECLRRGATLVAVRVPEADKGRYEAILNVGAVDVRVRIAQYRQEGWKMFNENSTVDD
jgi:hypothetical protein